MAVSIQASVKFYSTIVDCVHLKRDSRTGLCDCQARSQAALHSHFNASFTTLNLIKLNREKTMKALTIENTTERILTKMIRFLELETMAQQIDFNPELIELGHTIKQEWWQENKTRLLKTL